MPGMWGQGGRWLFSECVSIHMLVPKFLGSGKLQTGVCSWLPGNNRTGGTADTLPGRECLHWDFRGAFLSAWSSLGLALWQGW